MRVKWYQVLGILGAIASGLNKALSDDGTVDVIEGVEIISEVCQSLGVDVKGFDVAGDILKVVADVTDDDKNIHKDTLFSALENVAEKYGYKLI